MTKKPRPPPFKAFKRPPPGGRGFEGGKTVQEEAMLAGIEAYTREQASDVVMKIMEHCGKSAVYYLDNYQIPKEMKHNVFGSVMSTLFLNILCWGGKALVLRVHSLAGLEAGCKVADEAVTEFVATVKEALEIIKKEKGEKNAKTNSKD